MVKKDDNTEKIPQKQLGFTDGELVEEFRAHFREREFSQVKILCVMLNWWMAKDFESQKFLYHMPKDELRDYFINRDSGEEVVAQVHRGMNELLRRGIIPQAELMAKKKPSKKKKAAKKVGKEIMAPVKELEVRPDGDQKGRKGA
jgi:hypothetical protein